MHPYQPLNCDLYDYLELACLHGYELSIELVDGRSLTARALTTRTTSAEEFLVLQGDGESFEIRLDQLLAITPLTPGARFGRIQLAGSQCAP